MLHKCLDIQDQLFYLSNTLFALNILKLKKVLNIFKCHIQNMLGNNYNLRKIGPKKSEECLVASGGAGLIK